MTATMKSNGLRPTVDMREIYFSPPDTPPEKVRIDIAWPIAA